MCVKQHGLQPHSGHALADAATPDPRCVVTRAPWGTRSSAALAVTPAAPSRLALWLPLLVGLPWACPGPWCQLLAALPWPRQLDAHQALPLWQWRRRSLGRGQAGLAEHAVCPAGRCLPCAGASPWREAPQHPPGMSAQRLTLQLQVQPRLWLLPAARRRQACRESPHPTLSQPDHCTALAGHLPRQLIRHPSRLGTTGCSDEPAQPGSARLSHRWLLVAPPWAMLQPLWGRLLASLPWGCGACVGKGVGSWWATGWP